MLGSRKQGRAPGGRQRGKAEWSHTLPPHSGCMPLHEPLAWQVRSDDPRSVWPASQLKRIRLPRAKLSPRRMPWTGIPGSPQIPMLVPADQSHTNPFVLTWSKKRKWGPGRENIGPLLRGGMSATNERGES